jgi:hypothetical protein
MSLNIARLITLIGVVFWRALDAGAGEPANPTQAPDPQAESVDAVQLVREVHAEWSARCKKLGPLNPKMALGIWGTELKAVIGERVPKDRMHAFMFAVTAGGPGAELTGLHRSMVVQGLVAIFSRAGDRAELVGMLSRDFPDRMYYSDVEFWLAFKARRTLPNGIEVLFDAFDRSKDPKVREKIAASIGRAFRANRLDFGKNQATVDACRSWYAKNKAEVEPNMHYGDNRMHPQLPTDWYAMNGLFVSMSTAKQVETRGKDDRRNATGTGDVK